MSGATGLNPNIRLDQPKTDLGPDPLEIVVAEEADDAPVIDGAGNILEIKHPDGSITVSLDGRPIGSAGDRKAGGWFDNLVDEIDQQELSRIAEDLLRGVTDDIASRQEWIEDRAQGIKLLGLKIEIPGVTAGGDSAPIEGQSRVRHPLLLEAVLRFQANARSELLPTDGPVKIRNDSNTATGEQDRMGDALEKDLNHFLTAVATEYYPDTDRMLLMLGFGGTAFKKVYFCPLRNRPVSETVDADDLIVNQAATDLQNAKRVTHRVFMRPSTVKRLQILGVYRDLDLTTPQQRDVNAVQEAKNAQQGVADNASNPDDRDREIYECYCELDIRGFEHKHKGRESGLEIPYVVTIDRSSREILSIVRNYDEDDTVLPTARQTFVKYTFVPGMGFYDIGLLHILGNTTNAITAAWREMLDNGMYANFPGFLFAKQGARQNTNIFRVPPGGGAPIDTGNMPIQQAVMPLPYNTSGQAALQSLAGEMAQTGMRIGGTSEAQVGEGRADAPVGTTLAMIDQATKLLNAVHKRMHSAQAMEFQLLVRVFREHPEAFWERLNRPSYQWDEKTFLAAIKDADLVPQADPNTASHTQRIMKVMALKQLQAANPALYDAIAVDRMALTTIGWSNPDQFMAPPQSLAAPPPEVQEKIAKAKVAQQDADTRAKAVQIKAVEAMHEMQQGPDQAQDTQADMMDAHAKLLGAQTKSHEVEVRAAQAAVDDRNRDLDRKSREELQILQLAKDVLMHPDRAGMLPDVLGMIEGEGPMQ